MGGEWWILTFGKGIATNTSSPCADAGFHQYNRTDTIGVGPLQLKMDKYTPDAWNDANWTCNGCKCYSDNPNLWECCNDSNFSDCYEHLKWGDKKECEAFCK